MKKILLVIVFIVVVGFTSVFFISFFPKKSSETNSFELTISERVKNTMAQMTLEEKIGQMLIVYYSNSTVDDFLKKTIEEVKPGGFILMKENITTYDNTVKFISDLQQFSKIPMMITIDQEGGNVQRLQYLTDKNPLYIPYMYDLGNMGDSELAYRVGKVMAEQLKTLGVNVTFAPVVDIYSNPNNTVIGKRSFGSTPELVSNMSCSLARGLEDNGIIATYKHFPGHGDTATDSHSALPIITKSYEELKNLELIPFQQAIENDAKIIMVGHLALPNITGSNIPTSLSKTIVTDILKKDLGFQGLVVTDALNMGALTKNYSYEEIYIKAIEAGVDLLLMPNGSRNAVSIIQKNISEERINESVEKILTFKYTYLKDYQLLDSSYLNNDSQQAIIQQISNESSSQ